MVMTTLFLLHLPTNNFEIDYQCYKPMAVIEQGLFSENKEKLINGTLAALIAKEGDQSTIPNEELEMQFHALRRLVASKAGYAAFTKLAGLVYIVK